MTDDIYVIGNNWSGQFGFGHTNNVIKLTKWSKKANISNVYLGNCFSIFADDINQRYWSCGYNGSGQCGVNSKQDKIAKCTEITFFRNKNIFIKKVFVNITSPCVFWITTKNKLYCNGENKYYQLGLKNKQNRIIPSLINDKRLRNIIDIKGGSTFTFILCSNKYIIKTIVDNWYKHSDDLIHFINNDIINTIQQFYGISSIYFSGKRVNNKYAKIWTKMKYFDDKNIIKFSTGNDHCLFLSLNGNLYSYGSGNGWCGIHFCDKINKNQSKKGKIYLIPYFNDNNIQIIDISSGAYHNLILDNNGKIYSFGSNNLGQCGDGTKNTREHLQNRMDGNNYYISDRDELNKNLNVSLYHHIELLNDYKIKYIKCGRYHCYALSENGIYFMWGYNDEGGICLSKSSGRGNCLTTPTPINMVKKMTKCKKIKKVLLGTNNSFVFCK